MAEGAIRIRAATGGDEAPWRSLWRDYNRFYEASVPEETTQATWRRLLDPASGMGCLVAEESAGGIMLGFILYVIHPRSWDARDTCYLEDLYVADEARGRGVGRLLCDSLKRLCEDKGLSRIYWNTRESNHTARKLYDQIGVKDDFIRYVMKLG